MSESDQDYNERLGRFLAETINGGDWDDKNFYTDDQKQHWYEVAELVLQFVKRW